MIDICNMLRQFNGSMQEVILYGRIRKIVETPQIFSMPVQFLENGMFVVVDIFAVDLGIYKDYLKKQGIEDTVLYVNGSLLSYVTKGVDISKWYSFSGTLGSSKYNSLFLSLFEWRKNNKGEWGIKPSYLTKVNETVFDGVKRDYFRECIARGEVVQPSRVKTLSECTYIFNDKQRLNEINESNINNSVDNIKIEKKTYNEYLSRETVLINDEFVEILQGKLEESLSKQANLKEIEFLRFSIHENNDYLLDRVFSFIRRNNYLLTEYLKKFKESSHKYLGNTTVANYLIRIFDTEIIPFIKNHNAQVLVEGKAWNVCKKAFKDKENFAAGILGIYYDLDFSKVVNKCNFEDLSFIRVFFNNPYLLYIFDNSLSFNKVCKISLDLNLLNENIKYRNTCLIIEELKKGNDTVFRVDKFTKNNKYSTKIVNNGVISEKFSYCYSDALKDFIELGYGVSFGEYFTSTTLLNMELFVYKTLIKWGSETYDYSDSLINTYIVEYENRVGFRLEPEQSKAVKLVCKTRCCAVAGCAGSGKTTIIDCITYVLSKLEPNKMLYYSAPTGKAAKRMQEVVKDEVKTLNSRFKIGLDIDELDFESYEYMDGVHIFDECGMIKLQLFYEVLKRLRNERVYLFGDFHQLSPIGKGTPFRDLLRYLPCQFLKVSKRACEGSSITLNSDIVNNHSDSDNYLELVNNNDFYFIPVDNGNKISRIATLITSYYLNKCNDKEVQELKSILKVDELPYLENLQPDDIQIVSPLSKDTYSWGTIQLNNKLRHLFNSRLLTNEKYVYQGNSFFIGDRVIHTKVNMYDMQWYRHLGGNNFEKIEGNGIFNGEVGKIIGIYPSVNIKESSNNLCLPEYIRDDTTYTKWFVGVQYYDYMTDSDFVILYRCNNKRDRIFVGSDLANIELFYAGTVHKLQGSQSRLVISVFGDLRFNGFLTRNMVYTMITRASELEFVIGSSGQLRRARHDKSEQNILTVGELIYQEY